MALDVTDYFGTLARTNISVDEVRLCEWQSGVITAPYTRYVPHLVRHLQQKKSDQERAHLKPSATVHGPLLYRWTHKFRGKSLVFVSRLSLHVSTAQSLAHATSSARCLHSLIATLVHIQNWWSNKMNSDDRVLLSLRKESRGINTVRKYFANLSFGRCLRKHSGHQLSML